MSQEVTQSVAAAVVVLLTKNGVPVTSLVYTAVTAQFRKEGAVSFIAKTLTTGNFAEIGLGVYTITFSTSDLSAVGSFVVVVTGATIDQSTTIVNVKPATVASSPVSLETCIVTGHVYDLTGTPVLGATVSANVLGHPSIEQSAAVLQDTTTSVVTDSNGQFFLSLIRLTDVEVSIPVANYRRRFVVPNTSTADLFKDIA